MHGEFTFTSVIHSVFASEQWNGGPNKLERTVGHQPRKIKMAQRRKFFERTGDELLEHTDHDTTGNIISSSGCVAN